MDALLHTPSHPNAFIMALTSPTNPTQPLAHINHIPILYPSCFPNDLVLLALLCLSRDSLLNNPDISGEL